MIMDINLVGLSTKLPKRVPTPFFSACISHSRIIGQSPWLNSESSRFRCWGDLLTVASYKPKKIGQPV